MGMLSPAVRNLLLANGAFFLAAWLMRDTSAPGLSGPVMDWFSCWFPKHEKFRFWQVVTYMFLHGGIGHLFFNMFGLASFGLVLERVWGSGRFVVFYLVCGVGAALVHLSVEWFEYQSLHAQLVGLGARPEAIKTMLERPDIIQLMLENSQNSAALDPSVALIVKLYRVYAFPMVGASGAIYGILVAFGLMFPNAGLSLLFLPVPIPAKYFIPILLGLDLLSGVTGFSLFGGGVAHFAHLGGALIGFLLMWAWRDRRRSSSAPSEVG